MNMPATIEVGSRKYATFQDAIAASHITRAAIRRRDVPENPDAYGQDMARTDALAILDHLGIDRAHIVGLSMGGFAALHFGFHHADRAHSLVVAGCGYGAEPDKRAQFKTEANATADGIERDTMAVYGQVYGTGPARVQYQNKDPRGFNEFIDQLCEHSTLGSANTMRGVQASRPSLYDLQDQMRKLVVPTLIVNGDEDDPCLAPGMMMKSLIKVRHMSFCREQGTPLILKNRHFLICSWIISSIK